MRKTQKDLEAASSAIAAIKNGYKVILPCAYIGARDTERFEQKKVLLSARGIIIGQMVLVDCITGCEE